MTGRPKVNQAYVWGLAKNGTQLWFGTVPNTHCLVQGVYLGTTSAYGTGSWVCEFGDSQPARLGLPPSPPHIIPPGALPATVGDFRPPRIFMHDTATNTTTEKTLAGPAASLLASTVGIRAAGTLGDVVLLAGPALSGGVNVFAFRASTGTLVGATTLPSYANIRKFVVVDGVLYAGVGRRPSSPAVPGEKLGRILRWTGSLAGPVIAFEEVARLDSMAAELALHEGRIFVTTWPDGELTAGAREAGLYMSPPIPGGGFTAGGISDWEKVWTASDYEPDPVTASTYGGGALASFNGYLYWGTMHVPSLSTLAHFQAYSDETPGDTSGQLEWLLGSERAISIFRGRNFAGAPCPNSSRVCLISGSPEKEVLYGYAQMPTYVKTGPEPGSWQYRPSGMGAPRWGMAGFNNPLNNYTWSMAVAGERLWVGTMDWGWLLSAALIEGMSPAVTRAAFPGADGGLGADLWYFPDANSPAFPESTAGVGNPSSYGIRNMVVGPSLYLGMANPMNLLTDPGAGPLGGWELIELAERTPNTAAGSNTTVPLEGGGTLNFCRVDQAGYTTSRRAPLGEVLAQLAPQIQQPAELLLVVSSADWRGSESSGCWGDGIARVTAPHPTVSPTGRLLQLVWVPSAGTWAWQDITSSSAGGNVTGTLTANFLGVLAVLPGNAYPVGGTISGLGAGKSVVLQNNGGDDVTATMNGLFIFGTLVASGGNYAVTVKTQPGGQICSVSNGSGTATSIVIDVKVSCVDTYTVGGSVSGLGAGKSVVLQNNAGDDLTVSANGAFTFATSVLSGASYDVTVKTQPVGQTCSVSSGSGTVVAANITSVSVSCSTNSYTVGGSVSGLGTSKSVVLQNNAGDDLTVSANGTFTFATSVLSGAFYAVTVKTQPAGQQCVVTSGSGTVVASHVTTVTVQCYERSIASPLLGVSANITGGTCAGFDASTVSFAPPVNPPANAGTFDFGVLAFTAKSCSPGGSISLTIKYPKTLPYGTRFWKQVNGSWVDWTSRVTLQGDSVVVTITDGGEGDNNPNPGEISDPIGPAFLEGAFNVPVSSPWMLAALSLLLGFAAYGGLRRRRH